MVRTTKPKTYAWIVKLLKAGEMDTHEIAGEVGIHIETLHKFMYEMKALDLVHIVGWHEDTRGMRILRVYKLGKGRDLPRPKFTKAEESQRFRDRHAARKAMLKNPLFSLGAFHAQQEETQEENREAATSCV